MWTRWPPRPLGWGPLRRPIIHWRPQTCPFRFPVGSWPGRGIQEFQFRRGGQRPAGLVWWGGVRVRRPGSLPRSLPDTRLPPLPLEERSRPGPLAVRVEDPWSIQGPVEGRFDGGRPWCVPLLEVAPYVPLLGYGRGRGLLSGESHPLLQTDAGVVDSIPESTCPDFGAIQNRSDICLSNGRW